MKMRRAERGYNLIEVLIAMAMLGVVVLVIASLFVMGRKNVYSGKQMTVAVSIATRVMEDLSSLEKDDIAGTLFAIDLATEGDNITFGNPAITYENSALRSTAAIAGYADESVQGHDDDATLPDMLAKWSEQLEMTGGGGDTIERLTDGSVTLIMTPIRDEDPADTPTFGGAALLRLRVIVQWKEQRRVRQVIVDSVKAN